MVGDKEFWRRRNQNTFTIANGAAVLALLQLFGSGDEPIESVQENIIFFVPFLLGILFGGFTGLTAMVAESVKDDVWASSALKITRELLDKVTLIKDSNFLDIKEQDKQEADINKLEKKHSLSESDLRDISNKKQVFGNYEVSLQSSKGKLQKWKVSPWMLF